MHQVRKSKTCRKRRKDGDPNGHENSTECRGVEYASKRVASVGLEVYALALYDLKQ